MVAHGGPRVGGRCTRSSCTESEMISCTVYTDHTVVLGWDLRYSNYSIQYD